MDEPRYAIYFVPPADCALYRFGAGVLGYDCYTGERLRHPQYIALSASEWAQLTHEPRKYGFHATLKAPFRLLPPFTRNGSDGGTRTICRDPPNAAGDRARHPIARTLHCRRRRRAEHGARSAGSGRRDGLRPISPSFDFAREGATARRRLEPTPDRESRSMGLPLRVRRLSISSDLDGSDRRRPSWLGPGIVAGSFRRHRRRAFAADHATFIAAPGCVVDAVPGRRPSRADRGAFAAVDPTHGGTAIARCKTLDHPFAAVAVSSRCHMRLIGPNCGKKA